MQRTSRLTRVHETCNYTKYITYLREILTHFCNKVEYSIEKDIDRAGTRHEE